MSNFYKRSFIDPDLFWIMGRVENVIRDKNVVVWPMLPAYQFALAQQAKASGLNYADRAGCFGYIDLSVIKMPSATDARCPRLLVAAIRYRGAEGDTVARYLRKFNVEVIVQGPTESRGAFAERIQGALSDRPHGTETPNQPFNVWERKTRQLIRRGLFLEWDPVWPEESRELFAEIREEQSARFDVWSEIPVSCIVGSRELHENLKGDVKALNNRRMRASLDLLITTPAPNAEPLLAVEVDGSCHDRPEKQWNDELTNRLFEATGIPLMRVRVGDLRDDEEFKRGVYQRLIPTLADVVYPKTETPLEQRRNTRYLELLRKRIQRRSDNASETTVGPSDLRDMLSPPEADEFEQLQWDMTADDVMEEYDFITFHQRIAAGFGLSLNGPDVRVDGMDTFVVVTGALADGTQIQPVRGPTVRIDGPIRQDLRLNVQKQVAIELAFRKAADVNQLRAGRAQKELATSLQKLGIPKQGIQ